MYLSWHNTITRRRSGPPSATICKCYMARHYSFSLKSFICCASKVFLKLQQPVQPGPNFLWDSPHLYDYVKFWSVYMYFDVFHLHVPWCYFAFAIFVKQQHFFVICTTFHLICSSPAGLPLH